MISRCGASVIVLCSIMVVLVSANSGGLNIPCNVHPSQVPQGAFGTTNRQKSYLAGRAQTDENVVPMWWTLVPDWSDANAQRNGYTNTPRYTVRTADGPVGQDPTSYVPGQFIDIIVRTLERDQQFAGLLMYAQKGSAETGERVGEWLIPPRQNFQIDPTSGCVTHKNADPKNYKSVFRVRFPPGTGTVTIKALIKVGLAFPEMAGAFFWPNTRQQGFLTLTEQTNNLPTISWFQGNLGQSCNQVCAAKGGQCDAATMSSVGTNPTQLMAAVSRNSACFGPIMRGCGSFAPTVGTEGCFYSDTTCTRDPIRADDPCAGYPTWTLTTPKKAYHQLGNTNTPPLPSCVSHMGFLWCARGYTDNEPNTNNNWNRITACGADAALTLSYPATTRAAEPVDCTSVRTTAQDGQRLCACTGASQGGGGTLPTPGIPQNLPTSPASQAPSSTTTPPTSPVPAATTRPPTTSVPTMATSDSLMLSSFPPMINPTGSFVVRFSYSALGARTIVADVLSASFEWFGGGYVNVAAGSGGMVNVNVTMNGRATAGRNYMINYFLVDQQVFNNGQNPNAWQQKIALDTMPAGIMITMDPIPTSIPTEEPQATEDPTEPPSPTRRPTPKPIKANGATTKSTPVMLLISLMALACGSFHSLSSRSMMVLCVIGMVLLSTGLPGAEAHNWLTSPSRSNRGIGQGGDFNGWTSPPCPARSSRIHAQVGTGQRFPVEWASGHGYGSSTYLVIVKTADESRLREVDERMMDTYLREAPAEPYMADTKAWHVFSDGPGQKLGSLDQRITTNRPSNFKPFSAQAGTWSKTATATQNDKRAAYVNNKWPWIVAVHKFAMHEDRPEDADGALVEIPNGQPTGSYIVYYFWRGYYDCMDVNVLGGATLRTVDVFGSPVTPAVYGVDRTLHTTYPSNRPNYQVLGECRVMNEFEVVGTGNECFTECTQSYNQQNANSACQAIITVPIELPALGPFPAGRGHLPQRCMQQQRVANALNPSKTFVCYLVNGGTPPTVGPATKTVYDPEDPVFYHTAHLIRSPWKFTDVCTACQAPPPPVDWRYADKCISCADTAKNILGKGQPLWNFTDNCQHCDPRIA